MAVLEDFQIGDLVVVIDRDHVFNHLIFEVIRLNRGENVVVLKFLEEENSPGNVEKWNRNGIISLFPRRLSLYRTREINFIE